MFLSVRRLYILHSVQWPNLEIGFQFLFENYFWNGRKNVSQTTAGWTSSHRDYQDNLSVENWNRKTVINLPVLAVKWHILNKSWTWRKFVANQERMQNTHFCWKTLTPTNSVTQLSKRVYDTAHCFVSNCLLTWIVSVVFCRKQSL